MDTLKILSHCFGQKVTIGYPSMEMSGELRKDEAGYYLWQGYDGNGCDCRTYLEPNTICYVQCVWKD